MANETHEEEDRPGGPAASNMREVFRHRLEQAVKAAGLKSRTELGERLGVGDNAKQTVHQWGMRMWLPEKYRKPLEALGLSIDWINHGTGTLTIGNKSQDVRELRLIIRASLILHDRIRDLAFGSIPEHLQERVADEVANEVRERGAESILDGTGLDEAAESVRLRVRTGG